MRATELLHNIGQWLARHRRAVLHALFALVLLAVARVTAGSIADPPNPGGSHDEMVYIANHCLVMNHLKAGLSLKPLLQGDQMRKPYLPYIVSAFIHSHLPIGYAALQFSMWPFVFLYLLSLYGIGIKAYGQGVAIAGVCVMLGLPPVIGMFEGYNNDMHVTALTAAALLCFVYLLDKWKFRYWLLLGLAVGLGLLAKPTIPIYVLGATLFTLAAAAVFWAKSRNHHFAQTALLGMAAALVLALAIWVPWWRNFWPSVRTLLLDIGAGMGVDYQPFHQMDGVFFASALYEKLGKVDSLLFLAGLLSLLWSKDKHRRMLWLTFILPFALFMVMAEGFTRLLFPVLFIPLFAGLDAIARLPWKKTATAVLILLALISFQHYTKQHQPGPSCRMPHFAPENRARVGEQITTYMNEHSLPSEPGDALLLNACSPNATPEYYFLMLNLIDQKPVRFVHLWEDTGKRMMMNGPEQLGSRLNLVRLVLVNDANDEPDPAAIDGMMRRALQASYGTEADLSYIKLPKLTPAASFAFPGLANDGCHWHLLTAEPATATE